MIVGTILAGGLSRRMNGPEKSLLPLAGVPLIERVANRFSNQVHQLIINANGDPSRFERLGFPVVADTVEGFAGPLAGVLASMRWAMEQTDARHVLTVAADTPFFPNEYAERMRRGVQPDTIRLASSNGRRHPVFGLWPVDLADPLEQFLAAGERKVMLFVEQYANEMIEFNAENPDPFFNINTPEDIGLAETFLEEER